MKNGHDLMCEDMYNELFEDPGLEFLEGCKKQFSSFSGYETWQIRMNSWLGSWGWSHFAVYKPAKTRELWESVTLEIGAKLRKIGDSWVVIQPHPDSLFEKGDEIIAVNGIKKLSYQLINQTAGKFVVERDGKIKSLDIKLQEYRWNDEIYLHSKNQIVIPSFRKEFFKEEKDFLNLLKSIDSDEIIIDLRNNYGGNMGAGLHFLSYFFCSPKLVGYIERPRSSENEQDFPDTLDDYSQMDILEKSSKLNLRTFKRSYCTDKKIRVVINSATSSTAELVAQAFIDLERGTLIGQPSSGQLVLSKWNDVPHFPSGFSYSYPVATYKTIYDVMIEGYGVYPDVVKTYNLDYEKKGIDSFLVN